MAEGMSDRITRATDEHAAGPLPASVGVGSRRADRPEASPHAHKFRAVIALLVGLAIGVVAVTVIVLSGQRDAAPSAPWSEWRPLDSGMIGAREIADHIAPLYRISGVDQLALVTVVNLTSPTAAASAAASNGSSGTTPSGLQVAVQENPSSSAVSLLSGNTIAYNLCGIGTSNCAIAVGQPSTERLLLLRREAFELALYTFKYISGTDNVVAILPPGHTVTGCTGICPRPNTKPTTKPVDIAVLFFRGEMKQFLDQPVSFTLPERFPPSVAEIASAPEAPLVDQLTARTLFSERLVQAQDGSNLLLLNPQPPS
jgi:hypothetical protein